LRNQKKRSSSIIYNEILTIWLKKIVKIGPVDPETIGLRVISKKMKEITEGKIYSPFGKSAERAKSTVTDLNVE